MIGPDLNMCSLLKAEVVWTTLGTTLLVQSTVAKVGTKEKKVCAVILMHNILTLITNLIHMPNNTKKKEENENNSQCYHTKKLQRKILCTFSSFSMDWKLKNMPTFKFNIY